MPENRWWTSFIICVMVIATCVWGAVTIHFDYRWARSAWMQYRSLSYATAEGEVVSCKAIEVPASEGTSEHRVQIEYAYRVQRQDYRGTRVQYATTWSKDRVATFVDAHPPQTPIQVYYDPTDPNDAVLIRDADGTLLWRAMILAPFNLGMVVWVLLLVLVCRRETPNTSFRDSFHFIEDTESRIRVRRPPLHPIAVTFFTLIAALFAGILFGACCVPPPIPLSLMVIAWVLILGGNALVYRRAARTIVSGVFDLVVDREQKTLTLPTVDGNEGVVVSFDKVVGLEVKHWQDHEKNDRSSPTIHWSSESGEQKTSRLFDLSDEVTANEFVAWLRTRISMGT